MMSGIILNMEEKKSSSDDKSDIRNITIVYLKKKCHLSAIFHHDPVWFKPSATVQVTFLGGCSASWTWVLMCFSPLSDSPAAPRPVEGGPWSLELDGAVNIWWAAVCFQQLNRRPRSEKSEDSRANTNASSTNGRTRTAKRPVCTNTHHQSQTWLHVNTFKHAHVPFERSTVSCFVVYSDIYFENHFEFIYFYAF